MVLATMVVGSARVATAQSRPPSAQQPAGSIGIRLLEAPSGAADDPRAQVHIVDHLAPGTVIRRQISVSSTADTPVHAILYPAAATITGGSFVGADGATANDLSSWTTVTPKQVDVPAGGQAEATVTIAVPRDAAPGEQYGVVWAEVRSGAADGSGVAEVTRVGVRMYLSVGPGGAPAPDFAIETLTAGRSSDGAPTVLAAVHNTGGRALDLGGTLELSAGPGGVRAGPFPAALGTTLAIGATEPVTIVLDGQLPAGPWDATVTLHSGLVERSAHATLTFPAAGVAAPVAATPPASASGGGSGLGPVANALAATAAAAVVGGSAAVAIPRSRRWLRRLRPRRVPAHP
ncbi:MAG: hypothetical protein JWM47_2141 [Acidimicrobiales bacterium]|jgi:hypothetical protein|nr:hypothetical protein [Acidimicrobiales bacterium]